MSTAAFGFEHALNSAATDAQFTSDADNAPPTDPQLAYALLDLLGNTRPAENLSRWLSLAPARL